MGERYDYEAIIVGAGPNGLAAAITLARAGWKVLVLEGADSVGGGARTAELTLPGFKHDVCSAIHPFLLASPFLRSLPFADYGVKWIQPPAAAAHPLDGGAAVIVDRSVEATAESLGSDGGAYRRLMDPLVADWAKTVPGILGPLPFTPHHPVALARFGLPALLPARWLAESYFRGAPARAAFAGFAAHSMLPLEAPLTAAFGLVEMMLAHAAGWPIIQGGSQALPDAMAAYLRSLGGEIRTGAPVRSLGELPPARAVLFDVSPRQLLEIAGERLPAGFRRQLQRFRYGPGVCKVDFALAGPIPWQAPACARAGTVHVGGTSEEISASERAVWRGEHPQKPFVLLAQQSLFDSTRAPRGKHTAWAYCHVPSGSTYDMSGRIAGQIERFAPGFRDLILATAVHTAEKMEAYNPNYIGGDINGGVQDWRQFFTRPTVRPVPYSTPDSRIYLCSSSTPPGGGVHGMCGYNAAKAVLRRFAR